MLGDVLRALRESSGFSQTKVADDLKLNRVTYNRYETGEREPNSRILVKLASYFNVSVDYLLERTSIKAPITTAAAHRTDDYQTQLPPEAVLKINEIIELYKEKYKK